METIVQTPTHKINILYQALDFRRIYPWTKMTAAGIIVTSNILSERKQMKIDNISVACYSIVTR